MLILLILLFIFACVQDEAVVYDVDSDDISSTGGVFDTDSQYFYGETVDIHEMVAGDIIVLFR